MEEINGVLLVNKPLDYTSRDVVNVISKKLKTKKVGHTGTLDPIATGVLVVTVGKCTKLGEILTSEDKEYIATAILGYQTDTLDVTGNILNYKKLKRLDIKEVVESFKGKYLQEVPLYSAVKINGKKLYEYARNGEVVELPKREVEIKEIELLDVTYAEYPVIKFRCLVSKGTYIRSLINDIAARLDTLGTMSGLIRTKQGEFGIESCCELEMINESKLIDLNNIFKDYFTITVNSELEFKIKNGQVLEDIYNNDYVVFKNENVIALYKKEGDKIKPYKMFV